MPTFNATYSPEDNKLRLYVEGNERLEPELYAEVRAAGFIYAPVQKLFVTPRWTPTREDLCARLAGEIYAEESTMAERAIAKAARLDNLAIKNAGKADAFADAAHRIADRMVTGQPILSGHHSERRARKDADRMKAAQAQAAKCADSVRYWNWKAEGVERHANRKNCPRTRANRIAGLLKDLRDNQRHINHGYIVIRVWEKLAVMADLEEQQKAVEYYAGAHLKTGATNDRTAYNDMRTGAATAEQIIERGLAAGNHWANGTKTARYIQHTLNRLAYEQSEQGEVLRFTGTLTLVILQTFARTHGAESPKARKEGEQFILTSPIPLPCHIADGCEVSLTTSEWCDLMQACGYTPPVTERRASSKPKPASLLNPTREQAERLQKVWNAQLAARNKQAVPVELVEMTQAQYSANSGGSYSRYETLAIGATGERSQMVWREMVRVMNCEPVFRIRVAHSGGFNSAYRVIVITDAKQHSLPLDFDTIEAGLAAQRAEVAA